MAQPQDLSEQPDERIGVLLAKTRQRRMVRQVITGKNPESDVFHATPLDAPARRLADAVGVELDRKDHRRVIGGSTAAIGTVGGEELGEIEFADDVEDEPRQMRPSGSQSRMLGGMRKAWSRSAVTKL